MPTRELMMPNRTKTSSFSRSRTNPLGIGAASYKKLVTEIACLYEGARKALVEAYGTNSHEDFNGSWDRTDYLFKKIIRVSAGRSAAEILYHA